jgi:hypothetical protein
MNNQIDFIIQDNEPGVCTMLFCSISHDENTQSVQRKLPIGDIMKTLLSVLILLIFLLGCTTVYNHPTKSPQEFEKDRLECEHVAKQILAAQGIDGC